MNVGILLATCVMPVWRTEPPRPALSGPVESALSADGAFRVHWTLEGVDTPSGDIDGDVPEAVQQIFDGLEIGAAAFVERGYRTLDGDLGKGGDDAIDVYVRHLPVNGYAWPLVRGARDGGESCFMEIDGGLGGPADIVESVTVHELHHCIEYRYTPWTHSWIYEATATFEQYQTVRNAALDAAVSVLWGMRLGDAHLPMDSLDGDFEYAGFVVPWFWEQTGGSVPELWEALEVEPDWLAALEAHAPDSHGMDFGSLYLDHAVWNAFACNRDDGQHYDEGLLPCIIDTSVPVQALDWNDPSFAFVFEGGPSAAYFEIPAEGAVEAQCDYGEGEAGLALVHLDELGAAGVEATDIRPGRVTATLPARSSGTVLGVVTSLGVEGTDVHCTLSQVEEEEVGGCGCTTAAPSVWWGWVGGLVVALRRRSDG